MQQNTEIDNNGVVVLGQEGFNKYHNILQELILKFIFKEKLERHKEIEEKVEWTVIEEQ